MSLVDQKVVLRFLGLDQQTSADKNLEQIQDSVEAWVEDIYCQRNFISANYKEKYDGSGNDRLVLDNFPVTIVYRFSVGTDEAFSVKNTNTGAFASVSITSSSVVLRKDGVADSTLAFATYTTMQTMVNAINALSGWSATLASSLYSAYPSSLLMEKMGLQCINNRAASLPMPKEGEWDFEVDGDIGVIRLPSGFEKGYRNVYVDYDAGYATLPEDLKLAIMVLIKNVYQRRVEESFGLNSYSVAGMSVAFEQDMPLQAKAILDKYRKPLI